MLTTLRGIFNAAWLAAVLLGILTGCDQDMGYPTVMQPAQDMSYVEPAPMPCTPLYRYDPRWPYWCDDAGARLAYIYSHPYVYHPGSTVVVKHYVIPARTQTVRVSVPNRGTSWVSKPLGASGYSSRSSRPSGGGSISRPSSGAAGYSSRSKRP